MCIQAIGNVSYFYLEWNKLDKESELYQEYTSNFEKAGCGKFLMTYRALHNGGYGGMAFNTIGFATLMV